MVTPGLETKPVAVGVLSAPTRKLHKRAIIGVLLDLEAANARIAEVQPDLGAADAGLKSGDVILTVNGTAVKNGEELRNTLRDFREGQIVDLRVQRDSEEFTASVEMKPDTSAVSLPRGRGFGRRGNFAGGALSQRAEDIEVAMQHDTVLQTWQCGGPLVDLNGKAVGLNIARAGRIASYALPASLVTRIIADLKSRPMQPLQATASTGG
jgi:serine protease Do